MPESDITASEIQEIRFHLEAIEQTQLLLVRDRAEALIAFYRGQFEKHKHLLDVYRAVDGKRTQQAIVQFLNDAGVQVSQSTVSRRMDVLKHINLIDLRERQPQEGDVYAKNPIVERALRLSKLSAT